MGDLVTIARCYGNGEAAVIWSLLDQHAIFCVPMGAHHLSAQPWTMMALQGIELRVPAQDAEDARSILAHAGAEETYETCPACGSSRIFRQASFLNLLFCLVVGLGWGLLFVSSYALPVLAARRPTRRRHCQDCDTWWRAEPLPG
ncbi:MAG: hypothetical protein AB7O49_12170 [Sphingomonadales bacterium]